MTIPAIDATAASFASGRAMTSAAAASVPQSAQETKITNVGNGKKSTQPRLSRSAGAKARTTP